MVDELSEDEASGKIAEIYAEVRELWAVPYVSSIQRLLAAEPGFLEWAWDAVAPVFRNGLAQDAGWAAADGLDLPSLVAIAPADLSAWQVDDDTLKSIRDLSAGFVRVAPVNMVFAGLIRRRLEEGSQNGGRVPEDSDGASWQPPPALPPPPAMVAMPNPDATLNGILEKFGTDMDGAVFVPGLYRMLGHWPGLLQHLSQTLRPRLDDPQIRAAYDELRARIDEAVDDLAARLPTGQAVHNLPTEDGRARFMAVFGTYRKTSPEMVVAGRMIQAALPQRLG